MVSVTVSLPPVWASVKPEPTCRGKRLCRLGSAKVLCPSPPYVVPMRLNSVSYSEIGSSWPSQNIQPAGAKLPANMRISPTYGWLIYLLLCEWLEIATARG